MAQIVPITTTRGFDLQGEEAIDLKTIKTDVTDRDAITTPYEGLCVYTLAEKKNWQLRGPDADNDWIELFDSMTQFIDTGGGQPAAVGLPIKLDFEGYIDASFLRAGDASTYYLLDGTQPITAAFAGGGQQLKNIADGVDIADVVTIGQLPSVTVGNSNNLGGELSSSYLRSDISDAKTSGDLTFNDTTTLWFGTSNNTGMTYGGTTLLHVIDANSVVKFTLDVSSGNLTATDFVITSDLRLKDEVSYDVSSGIDGLKPISFKINGEFQYGFGAQDMLETHQELIKGTGEVKEDGSIDYYSIKQNSIIALLVKEVQELKQKINK